MESRPERPPNYLVRAIILLLVLMPLCLLLGSSSLYTTWRILTGPPVRSEIPAGMRAFMEILRALVAVIGFFIPIKTLFDARKVDIEFDAGNYGGARKASKSAATYFRQGVIFVVLILIIMGVELLSYFGSMKK